MELVFRGDHPIEHSRCNHVHLSSIEWIAARHSQIDLSIREQAVQFVFERWRARLKSFHPYQQNGLGLPRISGLDATRVAPSQNQERSCSSRSARTNTQRVSEPKLFLTLTAAPSGLGSLQLAITSDKSRRVVADELGVGMSTLCKWVKQHHRTPNAAEVISSISGLTTQQALGQENRRLKRELEILRLLDPEGSTFELGLSNFSRVRE